jgi:hypothetical protein
MAIDTTTEITPKPIPSLAEVKAQHTQNMASENAFENAEMRAQRDALLEKDLLGTDSPNRPLTSKQAGRWFSATAKAERNAKIAKLNKDARAAGEALAEFNRKGNILTDLKAITGNNTPIKDEGRIQGEVRRKKAMVQKNYWEITGGIATDIKDIKSGIRSVIPFLFRKK